jgi:hypothetical protein
MVVHLRVPHPGPQVPPYWQVATKASQVPGWLHCPCTVPRPSGAAGLVSNVSTRNVSGFSCTFRIRISRLGNDHTARAARFTAVELAILEI